MAKKLYEESNIQNIADAIRTKNGSTDNYKVSEMADAINDIPSGGNLEDFIPEEAFSVTGNCTYRFAFGAWDWFVERYGNKITTSDITTALYMFYQSKLKHIPFDLNFAEDMVDLKYLFNGCKELEYVPPLDFKQKSGKDDSHMFNGCESLKEVGKLSNLYPSTITYWFVRCYNLRYLPEFENLNLSAMQNLTTANYSRILSYCYSLRKIPEDFFKPFYGIQTTANSTFFASGFLSCYVLDEIVGMNPQTGTLTSNAFTTTFDLNSRAKDIIFATQENGVPYSVNWKSQTIDLSKEVGYTTSKTYILNYNSGITADKQVTDDTTYQALKNDPDWFTTDINYSRYNHDSAVNTINSLPDTSAYLASNGGTNTIKFKGESGKLTDGGAINTLTEAEIAVATAKGWTVTFA